MRDDFTRETLDTLAKRVGVRCSNPGCRKLTTGPRTEPTRVVNIGVGAHITAAAVGGPRFDSGLTVERRRSADNGIWLCQNCAKLIDNDRDRYTEQLLRSWKKSAEGAALSEIESSGVRADVAENMAELEISYRPQCRESERHDYHLEVTVRNQGSQVIDQYHVDLEMPTRVVDRPEQHSLYVRERSTRAVMFLRAAGQYHPGPIYPGDSRRVIRVRYYVDNAIYIDRGDLFDQPVTARLYRNNFAPLVVTKPFGELQQF